MRIRLVMNGKGRRKAAQVVRLLDKVRTILMGLELNELYEARPMERRQIAEYLKSVAFLKRTINRRHTNG